MYYKPALAIASACMHLHCKWPFDFWCRDQFTVALQYRILCMYGIYT